MKKSARSLSFVAAVALAPLLLAGCVQANPNAIGSLSKDKGSGTATAAPVTNATAAPTTAPTTAPPLDSETLNKQADSQNKSAKATAKHSKAEVQQAIFSAQFILDDLQNQRTLLNGQWAKAGHPTTPLLSRGSYFKQAAFTHLLEQVSKMEKSDQARGDLLLLTSYFPERDGHYAVCPDDGVDKTCLVSGYPSYTDLKYADAKGGGVYVEFNVEARYIATKDGVRGYIPVIKNVKLSLIPNPDYSKNSAGTPFIISGWSGSYERGSFAQ